VGGLPHEIIEVQIAAPDIGLLGRSSSNSHVAE